MKRFLFRYSVFLFLLVALAMSMLPESMARAASCYGSNCNGIDPSGTSCWNDAIPAAVQYAGSMTNINKYSPGCAANWSYTQDTSLSYLAAETVGVYTYKGRKPYRWVWDSMYDGTGYVCTKGHKGPSFNNYTIHTSSACG